MRRLVLSFCLLCAGPVWCEDIVDVLRRSQDMRLASMQEAEDNPQARTVRASFDAVMATLPHGVPSALRVIKGQVMAETLHGHIVVANEALAELPEDARLFIIAHELGHVVQNHWLQMAMLYQTWVPGTVTQEHTDAINGALQREASALAHRQEYEADAFAARTLTAMGRCAEPSESADTNANAGPFAGLACHDALLTVFRQPGASRETPTHPRASMRLAALRAHAFDSSLAPPTNASIDTFRGMQPDERQALSARASPMQGRERAGDRPAAPPPGR